MFQISLAAARVNVNLRQSDAATRIGVTAKTLRNYEIGNTAIPSHTLRKAAQIYKIPEEMIRLPVIQDNVYDEDEKNLEYSTV